MKLFDLLTQFQGASTIDDLNVEFAKLAPVFLYKGYIKVGDQYRIYIHTVEFYFHSEKDSVYTVQDPIVYHKNGMNDIDNVPYFPILSLHAHASGFDIAFENEKLKYRASVLIRAYSIYDEKAGCFLETQKKGRKWDDRSTFLYYYINGFNLQNNMNIEWVDEEACVPQLLENGKPRRNVFVYKDGKKTKEKDMRPWSFSRTNDILITI